MPNVPFEEVKDIFCTVWSNSEETLFHQIAWDCLEKAGLTTYSNELEQAKVHIYAYIVQMICEEFSDISFDETCCYDFQSDNEEPLTDIALTWLYKDTFPDAEFTSETYEMLEELCCRWRWDVADPIFKQIGELDVGYLLYFSINGPLSDEGSNDDNMDFHTKEALIHYVKEYCETNEKECFFDIILSTGHINDMGIIQNAGKDVMLEKLKDWTMKKKISEASSNERYSLDS